MRASFFDLRRRSRKILAALYRNERVTISYRGRPKAVMRPIKHPQRTGEAPQASNRPALGMWPDREDMADVTGCVRRLRPGRPDDL